MKYAGLPRRYIRAFKRLYANNKHLLRFMGSVYVAYVNQSGVKTGGPASGSLFVLCLDPFLRMLQSVCQPRDIGRAFADDIGYVLYDIRITLPKFAECFTVFGKISNVKIKIKKPLSSRFGHTTSRLLKQLFALLFRSGRMSKCRWMLNT